MPNVMAAQPNIGGALYESSLIPFLVPRLKVWLMECRAVTLPIYENARLGRKVNKICTWQNSVKGQEPKKCIYGVPAQETAKHRTKFGWPMASDVAALTKPRRESRWNLLGCPKLANRSQPLVGRSSPYCDDIWRRYCCLTSFFRLSIHALVAKT